MKTIQFIFIGLVIGMGFASCSSSNVTKKNEQAQVVKEKIENKRYTIDVDRMIPMNGRSRQLASNYSLTIKGDSVASYLPYFGQAYSVPYGGGQGLIFNAPITVYSISYDEKGTASISLQARSEDDVYRFNVQVFNNGSSSIQVTPNNRQSISYYGKLNMAKGD